MHTRSPAPDSRWAPRQAALPPGLSQLPGSQTGFLAGLTEETFKSPGCHMKSSPGSSFVIFRLKIKHPGTPMAAIVAAIET